MTRFTKPPSFSCYPGDLLSDGNVELMTAEEFGAYWRLCCHAWLDSTRIAIGKLCYDDAILAGLSRLGLERWKTAKTAILRAFDCESEPGVIIQRRLVEERQRQLIHSKQKSIAGKIGAKYRWKKSDSIRMRVPYQSDASVMRSQCGRNAIGIAENSSSSSSSNKNKDKDTAKNAVVSSEPLDSDSRIEPLKELMAETWEKYRGCSLTTATSKKDWTQFSALMKRSRADPASDLHALKAAWLRFVGSQDQFVQKQGLAYWATHIGAFMAPVLATDRDVGSEIDEFESNPDREEWIAESVAAEKEFAKSIGEREAKRIRAKSDPTDGELFWLKAYEKREIPDEPEN